MSMQAGWDLEDDIRSQIDALDLVKGRPIIVSDADEVLVQFISGLEKYLDTQGLWLDLQSFMLTGNIKYRETGDVFDKSGMPRLMEGFFISETDQLEPVLGAAEALSHLSSHAQIIVLSNIPMQQREQRSANLASHGMPYPVVANRGLKGNAVRYIAAMVEAPLFFLDDLPHNIESVAQAHAPSHRIHFVAHEGLARVVPKAADGHFHTSEWEAAQDFILSRLDVAHDE
jgi:hypothetical protein